MLVDPTPCSTTDHVPSIIAASSPASIDSDIEVNPLMSDDLGWSLVRIEEFLANNRQARAHAFACLDHPSQSSVHYVEAVAASRSRPSHNEIPTRLMIIGGLIGALILPAVSWPAGIWCGLVALAGWMISRRGRPTSRLAYGWTAFRPRQPGR